MAFCNFIFSPKAITKSGGRVFDVNVDLLDPLTGPLITHLNHLTALEIKVDLSLQELERQTSGVYPLRNETL